MLATANYVFRKLMSPELGGIAYDEAASLHAGAAFPALPEMEEEKTETWHAAYETELLLLDDKAPELEDDKSRETKMETEAAAVAARSARWSEMRKSWAKRPGNTGKFSTAIS